MSLLRIDPTRTTRLRVQFNSALAVRFEMLRKELQQLLIQGDAFGMKRSIPVLRFGPTYNAEEWRFLTDDRKLEQLKKWLQFKTGQLFLKQSHDDAAQTWLGSYIQQAYQRGLKRAYTDWKRPTGPMPMSKEAGQAYQQGQAAEFMRQSFGGPVPLERVRVLAARTYNDLNGVTEQMSTTITRTLLDGMVNGLSPRKIGQQLNKVVEGYKRRGTTIARTECLPGETLVDAAMVRAVFRRWYVGPMVKIKTANGREFSATPNHPMLTKDGWIATGEIQEGDQLISSGWNKNARASRNQNVDHRPATLRQIFGSLESTRVIERNTTTTSDFHGDGLESEVDILRANRELRVGDFTPLYKPLLEDVFSFTGQSTSGFCSLCGCLLPINERPCLCFSSGGNPGLTESFLDPSGTKVNLSRDFGQGNSGNILFDNSFYIDVGSSSWMDSPEFIKVSPSFGKRSTDTLLPKNSTNCFLVDTSLGSNLSLGHSCQIELDNVISVEFYSFTGHVYNLETDCGYFTIDSLYTGNTIRAFNEGALDGLQNLGATQIGVMVEWSVSGLGTTRKGNLSPCKKCAPLSGIVLTVDEARGLLPRHPNCLCSLIPSNVGEKTTGQIRDAERIRAAIARSARGDSRWVGASKSISSRRPAIQEQQ